MDLDPNLVWSLGVNAEMPFGAAPAPVDPTSPPTTLVPAHVRFADNPGDLLNVNVTLDAYDPNVQKPPIKLVGVYAPLPIPDGADVAWYQSNAFPSTPVIDCPVPDPSQPTNFTLAYSGPEIFDPRRYQILEGHTA